MLFKARRIEREVNYSPDHPLKEFAVLVGGLVGGLAAIYLALGLAVDLVVPHISPSLEDQLGAAMAPRAAEGKRSPAEERLQAVLDGLTALRGERDRDYRVFLMEAEEANAMALPGGNIVVMTQLVREARSENELAMVLGHELGHFSSRDHLRGLGRGLVLVFLSSLLLGTDSAASSFAQAALGGVEVQFSQKQELEADAFGLELLVKRYGHAGGATDFFQRILEGGEERLRYLFASHPYPAERIAALERAIRDGVYASGDTVPLDGAFQDFNLTEH